MTAALGFDVHGPGDAPVLVLGSSVGTTRTLWDEQLPALAERFRVVRYDHRGHGASTVPPGPYRLPELAGDVVALLDELEVERAHVVGLSLGGMVALQLAATSPGRVDRLALVCTAAHFPATQMWLDRAATVRSQGMAAIVDAVTSRWFTPAFAGSERAAELSDGLREVPAEGYAACCEAIAAMDLRPLLGEIVAPTLVVAGAQDPATPPEMGAALVGGIRAGGGEARLETVDGAAHLGNVEKADEVTQLLLEHLTGERADVEPTGE